MNIYSCVDSKNIDKIITVFLSCYINSSDKENLNFYLLIDYMIEKDELDKLIPDILKIKIKALDFKDLENKGWLKINRDFSIYFYKYSKSCNHIMNFARFFIFDYFDELDRVIYLDWDMIVRCDITNLKSDYNTDKFIVAKRNWNIEMSVFEFMEKLSFDRNIFKKKPNLLIEYRNKSKMLNNFLSEISNNNKNFLSEPGFNAGFYICSKSNFESENLKNLVIKMINFQKKFKNLKHGTQTILIFLTLNYVKFTDKRWNTTITSNKEDSFIYHWNGVNKPWKNNDILWLDYYDKYKNITKEK